ncbi:putative FAD-binding domain-containing protein [Seiridium cardinale]|uniref:FAD-binding domain-containing protein n=1 Tax=Seiridium cardinale TaxID=138064 RepID=A0ABR2Y6Z5_9PEZI
MAPVLIIGGGISGLCLAQALSKLKIDFKVFERDPSTSFRGQGYRIRLAIGTDVIKQVTPPNVAKLFADTCAIDPQSMQKFNAITHESIPSQFGGEARLKVWAKGTPSTVDRTTLRNVLTTDIGERIIFGKSFTRYEVDENGVTAYFSDGTSERGSLLVGAEGKNSRVAKQLAPKNPLLDTEGRIFYGKTPLTPDLRELSSIRGWNGMQVFEDRKADRSPLLMFHENICWSDEIRNGIKDISLPPDYIYWVLVTQLSNLPWSDEELASFNAGRVAEATLALTKDWNSDIRCVFENQDKSQVAVLKITSAPSEIQAWDSSRFVTIIGDAAHAMPPTGASGANTALKDVELLVAQIEKHSINGLTAEGIRAYEDEMRKYASEFLKLSFGAAASMIGQKPMEELKPVTDRW